MGFWIVFPTGGQAVVGSLGRQVPRGNHQATEIFPEHSKHQKHQSKIDEVLRRFGITGHYPLVNQHNYGKSPFYSWVYQLFQWPSSSKQTVNVYQREKLPKLYAKVDGFGGQMCFLRTCSVSVFLLQQLWHV